MAAAARDLAAEVNADPGHGGGAALCFRPRAPLSRPHGLRGSRSLSRPGAPPSQAPRGRAARDVQFDRWADHPGFGRTPQRLVQIFRHADAGFRASNATSSRLSMMSKRSASHSNSFFDWPFLVAVNRTLCVRAMCRRVASKPAAENAPSSSYPSIKMSLPQRSVARDQPRTRRFESSLGARRDCAGCVRAHRGIPHWRLRPSR